MNEALTRDVIMRAMASLRERGILPSVDLPPVILVPLAGESLPGERVYVTHIAVNLAQAAENADLPNAQPAALATILASYLAEVVDLVPAYSDIHHVESDSAGAIYLYVRV